MNDEKDSTTFHIGQAVKRIYATVPMDVFYSFRDRCNAEKVSLDAAFSELVTQYAHGAVLTFVKHRAPSTGADYLKK